jgi:hypothetical protein
MKRRLIRTLALKSVLSVVLPFQVTPAEQGTSDPFILRILDDEGRGIPDIRVVSDNGIVCRTQADGSVRWTERSVTNRYVRFRLDWSQSQIGSRPCDFSPGRGVANKPVSPDVARRNGPINSS